MARRCDITGKGPLTGNNVSHANNKTKRKFLPNLKKVKFTSEILKRNLRLNVSNAAVRSVDKKGSFDEFLKDVKIKNLSPRLKKIKKIIFSNSISFLSNNPQCLFNPLNINKTNVPQSLHNSPLQILTPILPPGITNIME